MGEWSIVGGGCIRLLLLPTFSPSAIVVTWEFVTGDAEIGVEDELREEDDVACRRSGGRRWEEPDGLDPPTPTLAVLRPSFRCAW